MARDPTTPSHRTSSLSTSTSPRRTAVTQRDVAVGTIPPPAEKLTPVLIAHEVEDS
jgi:hypothetical protein